MGHYFEPRRPPAPTTPGRKLQVLRRCRVVTSRQLGSMVDCAPLLILELESNMVMMTDKLARELEDALSIETGYLNGGGG